MSSVKREKLVRGAKSYLNSLVKRRSMSMVTADDVQRYLDNNKFRGGQNDRLSIVRSVLREPNFTPIGQQPSNRPEARRRLVTVWTA